MVCSATSSRRPWTPCKARNANCVPLCAHGRTMCIQHKLAFSFVMYAVPRQSSACGVYFDERGRKVRERLCFFFLSLSESSLVRQSPRSDTHLQVPNVLRCWFEEYRYRTQRYQCHRYRSATLLKRFLCTILRDLSAKPWRKCTNQDEFLKSLHRLSSSFAKATRNLLCALLGIFIFRAAININLLL